MTTLAMERLRPPVSSRDARVLDWTGRQAASALAGRTVWCACTSPLAHDAAGALIDHLRAELAGDLDSRAIGVEVDAPLVHLTERLELMLRGGIGEGRPLGPEETEIYSVRADEGEELIGRELRRGDVVVLHDPFAASLAQAARARGAHVVWSLSIGPRQRSADEAWRFLGRWCTSLDAYMTSPRTPRSEGPTRAEVAAYISAPDVLSAKVAADAPDRRYEHLGWASLLADIVSTDRDERVGGTLRPRPGVAVR